MSKPTEAQLTPVERAAQATAGTWGSGLNDVVFRAGQKLFPLGSFVLGGRAEQEIFGLAPNPIGARELHSTMYGLDPRQVAALTAADHIARGEGVWIDQNLREKYPALCAALATGAYLDPDQAEITMRMIRELNTYDGSEEMSAEDYRRHAASGAPHKGMDALAELAINISDHMSPLDVIALTRGHECRPITLAQRRMQKDIIDANAVRTLALAAGGIFGAFTVNSLCLPAVAVPAAVSLVRGGDSRRLNALIGGPAPKALAAWQELWKSQGIVEQFMHHLCVGKVISKSGALVRRNIDPDRNMNPTTRSVSSVFLNSLSGVKDIATLQEKVRQLNGAATHAVKSGRPLSDVLGLLHDIDQMKDAAQHNALPPKDTDLNKVIRTSGKDLSDAVKNVSQDRKLMLALPVMMRLAIAFGPPTTNVFKTTGDNAVKSWGLTGFDKNLLRAYMDKYNSNSFSAEASGYKGKSRFPDFDAIIAQRFPHHDMDDLCVLASFQESGHVSNLLRSGMWITDPEATKSKTGLNPSDFVNSEMKKLVENEQAETSEEDPIERAKRKPSSPDNVFKAMMALSSLRYYRNRADALQQHFNATEGNTAFFNQSRTNLDVASKAIITGVLESFLGERASLVHLASSQSGDDLNLIKSLSTFVEWANREYPEDLAEALVEPLKTCLDQTGQSKTPDPWSKEFTLFMGHIASEKRFGPVLQGVANDHLVTMLDDTLNTHLSPLSVQTQDVYRMVTAAQSSLPILVSYINITRGTERSRVLESISKYLDACSTPPRATIAQQHAADRSVPAVQAVETRRFATSPTLNCLRDFLTKLTFIPDKVTRKRSREQIQRDVMVIDIDNKLKLLTNPAGHR